MSFEKGTKSWPLLHRRANLPFKYLASILRQNGDFTLQMETFSTSSSAPPKTVVWVDTHVTYGDPTMRQLLLALPQLKNAGWTVEVWCLRSDLPPGAIKHRFLPVLPGLGPLTLVYFSVIVNLYGIWRWLTRAGRPAIIVHATCGTYFGADLATVQFLNFVWLRKQWELGFSSWKERAQFLLHCGGAIFEQLHWWSPALRLVLAVSDAVADDIRPRLLRPVPIETLPNSYDAERFNLRVRAERREAIREDLGFRPGQVVFIFVSLGHHKRKGFWLAVEALLRLRKDPSMRNTRFLVVGGLPATLAALQLRLDDMAPDWRDWIVFTGAQAAVENYFAAADAFLYPSYFEAFCIAEIEAAAMGLPLLLTRHHGSEMILEEGVNGWWLDFDPASIAETLRRFVVLGSAGFRFSTGRALTRDTFAQRLLSIYERFVEEGFPKR